MANNNRRGLGSFNYRSSNSGPKLTGIDSLINSQNAQNNLMGRSAAGQQQIGPNEILLGRTDPYSQTRTTTPEAIDVDVQTDLRKKASEDVLKLSQAYKFVQSLRKQYSDAYKGMKGEKSGLPGGLNAGKEYVTGVIGRQNKDLRNYIDSYDASGVSLGKFGGDTGNFALQEQKSALKRAPKATPNLDIGRAFLPDDPEYGESKFDEIERIFLEKMNEAQEVAKTGIPIGGYAKSNTNTLNNQSNGGGIEKERQDAIAKIQSGKYDAKKVADIFRQRTGQELNV